VPFNEWIKAARVAARFSQVAAGATSEVSRSTWQKLEHPDSVKGNVHVKGSTLRAVAELLGLDAAEVFRRAGKDETTAEVGVAGRPLASVTELRDKLADLSPVQRQAVVNLIDAFRTGVTAPATIDGDELFHGSPDDRRND